MCGGPTDHLHEARMNFVVSDPRVRLDACRLGGSPCRSGTEFELPDFPGGGTSVPLYRVSPPLGQELEARAELLVMSTLFVSCVSAHTQSSSCLQFRPCALAPTAIMRVVDVGLKCCAVKRRAP